jgi:hypothetical protein
MAKLDIAKLAARLGELNKPRGEGGGMSFIDIKDGDNRVRLFPGKDDPNDFFEEVWVHYGVGKGEGNSKGTMVVCPKTKNENAQCDVCELSSQLKKLSKKKDDNYDKQAKSVYRKKRVYFNAISKDDQSKYEKREDGDKLKWHNVTEDREESPVKVLGTGIDVYKQILALLVNPEYGVDILDTTNEGLDLIITKTGSGQFNTEYKVIAARKGSAVGFDEWESCLHSLKDLSKIKTREEIQAIMSGESSDKPLRDKDEEDGDEPVDISDKSGDTGGNEELEDEIKAALQRRKNK